MLSRRTKSRSAPPHCFLESLLLSQTFNVRTSFFPLARGDFYGGSGQLACPSTNQLARLSHGEHLASGSEQPRHLALRDFWLKQSFLPKKCSFKKKHSQLPDRGTPLPAVPQPHRQHSNARAFKSQVPATPGANHSSPESGEQFAGESPHTRAKLRSVSLITSTNPTIFLITSESPARPAQQPGGAQPSSRRVERPFVLVCASINRINWKETCVFWGKQLQFSQTWLLRDQQVIKKKGIKMSQFLD